MQEHVLGRFEETLVFSANNRKPFPYTNEKIRFKIGTSGSDKLKCIN